MQILETILLILLFILCLSILITIHELGHFLMAKAFGVYCFEFSIGFGPKIIRHKRQKGETYFAWRCIPFGGYVSMYGEGMELPEGMEPLPKERSLNGIKTWKRIIILAAGVTMNALLALTMFFVYESAFEKYTWYADKLTFDLEEEYASYGSPLRDAGFTEDQYLYYEKSNLDYVFILDKEAKINKEDGTTVDVYAVIDGNVLYGYDFTYMEYYMHFCEPIDGQISYDREIKASDSVKSVSLTVYSSTDDNNGKENAYPITLNRINDKEDGTYRFQPIGASFYHQWYRVTDFGQILKNTFTDFGESSVAVVSGFAQMFTTKEGFESAGGLIAIGYETSNILKQWGFGQFLMTWGMISVNLAIVNLFPFPGLDGYQILVLLIEKIAHKEIPTKVKSILSLVGIGLLFIFMIFLLFKDFFVYVI